MATSPDRYPYAYRILHWSIAVGVIILFSMQYLRRPFGEGAHVVVREAHKSIGIILIVLVAVRLFLFLTRPMPRPFPDASLLRRTAAAIIHRGLWLLMIAVPLLGVTFILARGRGVNFFGLVTLGPWTAGSASWGEIALGVHRYAAFALVTLVCIHAAGAVFHCLVLRDGLLARMSLRRTEDR